MTWVYKHRQTGGLIVAEYECPVHGRFEVTLERDANGDAPEFAHCISGDRDALEVECVNACRFVFPAPMGRVQRVTAARRGKDPEPPPNVMDWRSLAEGMDHDEWEKKERKKDFEHLHKLSRARFT